VCMCIYVHMYTKQEPGVTSMCVCACVYLHIYVCMCVCVRMCTYVYNTGARCG